MATETVTCVIDANTLIDNIHQIKALIYDGHIQLCVPLSSTFERLLEASVADSWIAVDHVDHIYRKSIEKSSEPEKAARPKFGGKPSRVYPTFDISPRVTKEFLERSKENLEKLSKEDSENSAVVFQKEEEQYTPWKNLELQEEQERQKNAEKPATFAAALLAKLNIAEAPASSSKG